MSGPLWIKYGYALYRVEGWRVFRCFTALLGCNHTRTPVHEGKCFCPDCGEGVIFQWVVLHCAGCGHKRDSRYWLRRVIPITPCCTGCGEAGFSPVYLESPQYYQLYKAKLVAREEREFLGQQPFRTIRVWLEQMDRQARPNGVKALLSIAG